MFTIGIDFGTESARAVVNCRDGHEVASVVHHYAHGVLDQHLPDSDQPLPPDWALQDPAEDCALFGIIAQPVYEALSKYLAWEVYHHQ
jgi:ribulose kinase